MYVVVVYDVNVERVNKICQFLRRFLNHVQNSVFEGELTQSEYERVVRGIKELIDEKEDSVLIYIFKSEKYVSKRRLGVEKRETGTII